VCFRLSAKGCEKVQEGVVPTGLITLHRDGRRPWLMVSSLRRVPGSVVDVPRRISEGETQRMLVRTHPLAGGGPLVNGAIRPPPTTTQRCQVPSGWMAPSHLLATPPPYRQPALAGGAEAISHPAISMAASPPTMQCFIVVSLGAYPVPDTRLPLVSLSFRCL
jgi:hypothetical protein